MHAPMAAALAGSSSDSEGVVFPLESRRSCMPRRAVLTGAFLLVAVGACCLAILPRPRSLAEPLALQQKWKRPGHGGHGGGRWERPAGPFGWSQLGHPEGVPLGKLFHQADEDQSGTIEAGEHKGLSEAVRRHFNMSAPQFERAYGGVFNGSERLDFRSFKTLAGVLFVFERADTDQDAGQELSLQGFALAEELKRLPLPEGGVQKLLHEADTDDLQGLSAAELKGFLESLQDFELGPVLMGVWFRLDEDGDEVLNATELEGLLPELEGSLSLSREYVRPMLGEPEEMDRRDFRRLVFKAWGGPPMQHLGRGPPVLVLFRKCDGDGSLFLEEGELQGLPYGLFKDVDVKGLASSADGDGDGKLSPAEFTAFLEAALPKKSGGHAPPRGPRPEQKRKQKRGQKRGQKREKKKPASEEGGPETEAALFEELDRNGDEAIGGAEVEEMTGRLLKLFEVDENIYKSLLAAADLDADAELNKGEFEELVGALNAMPRAAGEARKGLVEE